MEGMDPSLASPMSSSGATERGGSRKPWLMDNRFEVAVGAGTLMSDSSDAAHFPHRWTPDGVTVEADFTGGHLLHLAAAGCVLNDVYREAAKLGIEVQGARVTAAGGFDTATWEPQASTIGSKSALMHPLANSLICWRSSTTWPRSRAP